MKKAFFKEVNWDKVRRRQISPDEVPYKPNPNKYRYLLSNTYPDTSNLAKADEPGSGCSHSPGKNLLGDFTVYKVNKEFDNF